jgi:hypothetical protein
MKLTKVFKFNFLILLGKYKKLKILSIEHRVGLPTKKGVHNVVIVTGFEPVTFGSNAPML